MFFPQRPEALTQLGAALHFYGISLRFARTPQAKGKIERQHQYWQGRLPALFAAEAITTPLAANDLLTTLRHHRNAKEIHREIGRTPDAAARRPSKINRTSCAQHPAARDGLTFGVSARRSKSGRTDASRQAWNDCGSLARWVPR